MPPSSLDQSPQPSPRRSPRRGLFVFLGIGLAALTGCSAFLPKTTQPIPVTWHAAGTTRADTLIVFLPGRGDRAEDFAAKGFLDDLRQAGIKADVAAVDAHLGYYYARTIVTRLREDLLIPARAKGYRRIVAVGISLGGLGTLLATRDAHEYIDAAVLIAPYLGDRESLFAEIEAAGGPVRWAAPRKLREHEDVQEAIWTYLGQHYQDLPPTWLLTGDRDYLLAGQKLLAPLLPAERVKITPGKHNWKTWEKLWADFCTTADTFQEERAEHP